MPGPRTLTSPLGLAVLAALHGRYLAPQDGDRSMHPYEIATTLRTWGKDQSIKIKWGTLYTQVQTLEKRGYIEATGTTRQGRRPERTSYQITPAGLEALENTLREMIGFPEREYPAFESALSLLPVLHPDEATALLERRLRQLELQAHAELGLLTQAGTSVSRMFLVEGEYHVAMVQAEAEWIRGLLAELRGGTFPDLADWRAAAETGVLPTVWQQGPDAAAGGRDISDSGPAGSKGGTRDEKGGQATESH